VARHEPPAVRKKQILEAALRCFGEKGLRAATMDDVVAASGLSKGAIYSHFQSKDEIFRALYGLFELDLFEAWSRLPRTDPLETMRRMGDLFLERLLATRPLLDCWTEFLRQPASRERMAETYRESRRRLADLLREGIAEGRVVDSNAEHLAASLTALVEGLLLQAYVDPDFDPMAAWPTAWQLAARGLAA